MGKTASEGGFLKGIEQIGTDLKKFSDKIEKKPGNKPEIIVFLLYTLGHFLMSLVHEPWFDEALAWLIARDSTVKEILFEATHFEGHPGLWHLVLMPFAKLGLPYEISLSAISYFFTGLAMWFFIRKSPFKRIIRLIMPFSYFLFYQYSVVSRPYSMMMLALVLAAILYKSRNAKPVRYIAVLAFLCASSAYGIVMAGGICIAWLFEMWIDTGKKANISDEKQKSRISHFLHNITEHGKLFWLLALLGYAILIIIRIIPDERAYASVRTEYADGETSLWIRLIYTFFGSLSDLFVTNTFYEFGTLRTAGFSKGDLLTVILFGGIILAVILYYGKKNGKLLSFCIPFSLLAVFSAFVYICPYHVGVFLLFLGYWTWTCVEKQAESCNTDGTSYKSDTAAKKNEDSQSGLNAVKNALPAFGRIAVILMLGISLFWTFLTCITEIRYDYGSGHSIYEFLRENELEDASILCEWDTIFSEAAGVDNFDNNDVAFSHYAINLAPYLTENTVLNLNPELTKRMAYCHYVNDKKECRTEIEKIAENGFPDVLIGWPPLIEFFDIDELSLKDYAKVFEVKTGTIWKGAKSLKNTVVLVRKTIAEEKGLRTLGINVEQ